MTKKVKNISSQIALLTTLQLRWKETGDIAASLIYSNNYFSLLPSNEKIIEIGNIQHFPLSKGLVLEAYAYNAQVQKISL